MSHCRHLRRLRSIAVSSPLLAGFYCVVIVLLLIVSLSSCHCLFCSRAVKCYRFIVLYHYFVVASLLRLTADNDNASDRCLVSFIVHLWKSRVPRVFPCRWWLIEALPVGLIFACYIVVDVLKKACYAESYLKFFEQPRVERLSDCALCFV